MKAYVEWLKALPAKPVFVGYPAGFDFLFVYWYLIRFAGESPCLVLGAGYQELRDGDARHRLPEYRQAEHAQGMVRRLASQRTSGAG